MHTFKIPAIDFGADAWWKLTDVAASAREPNTTLHLSMTDLQALEELTDLATPSIPWLPAHAQGTERFVQLVSQVSKRVVGWERRHSTIMATVGLSGLSMTPSLVTLVRAFLTFFKYFLS